jgi:hypothetical protein
MRVNTLALSEIAWKWLESSVCPLVSSGGAGANLPSREPLREGPLGPRELHDIVGGVLQRDELTPAGQVNRIIEGARP